jgi:hypothetical protein
MTGLSADKILKTLRLLPECCCAPQKSGQDELPIAIRDDYPCEWEAIGGQSLTLQQTELLRRLGVRFRAGALLLNRLQHVRPFVA